MISFYSDVKKEKVYEKKSVEEFIDKNYVIHFNRYTDLLGLVQANFSYDARNLKCLFEYKDIENQLIDRYLREKPLINMKKMPSFEYSDEIYDKNVFKRLDGGNEQVNYNFLIEILHFN